jgi:hypothetical protein
MSDREDALATFKAMVEERDSALAERKEQRISHEKQISEFRNIQRKLERANKLLMIGWVVSGLAFSTALVLVWLLR